MTAFITRCCKSIEPNHALVALFVALWFAFTAASVHADGIDIRKAALNATEDGYTLTADIDVQLTPLLDDTLHKGVPLYFTLEFELIRSRWYWFNEKIAGARQQYRLSYNALTRQYRIGTGELYQNMSSLSEALAYMSHVRRREDIEPGSLRKDTNYAAALRLRLDTTQLPKPFQLTAVGSRDWSIGSDWYRWTVVP